jgi:hypothetical protein
MQAKTEAESNTLLAQRLAPYVVIKSSPKIFRRLVARYSKPFWRALTAITSKDLDTFPLPEPYRLTEPQIRRDRAFLAVISGEAQRYLEWIAVQTPSLLAASAVAKSGERNEYSFYSVSTAGEVHALLCGLLSDLKDYTCIIALLTSLPKERFREEVEAFEGAESDEMVEKRLKNCVFRVGICLHLLWLLVHSSAMEVHLSRIHPILVQHAGDQEVPDEGENAGANANREFDDVDPEDAGNEGDDLEDIQLDCRPLPPMAAKCMQWLRLQVAHYQAIDTIGRACWRLSQMQGQNGVPSLSIRVVAARHPGREMQPWKELVQNLVAAPSSGDPANFTADNVIGAVDVKMMSPKAPPVADENITVTTKKTLPAVNADGQKARIGPSWYTSNHFDGAAHCEACLASLIDNQEVNNDVLRAFRASYSLFSSNRVLMQSDVGREQNNDRRI